MSQPFSVYACNCLVALEALGHPSDDNMHDGAAIHALLLLAKDGLLANVDPPTEADRRDFAETLAHLDRNREVLEELGVLAQARHWVRSTGNLRQLQVV
jgi:hypothetical protein